MFPSDQDIEAFKTEFGRESILQRSAIPRQSCCGTQAAVVITPQDTKDATLAHAWELVRSIARWILARASGLPPSERYEIIVGWSQSVRRSQGQIFKAGGDHAAIETIADSAEWTQCGRAPLVRWEKDVFETRGPDHAPQRTHVSCMPTEKPKRSDDWYFPPDMAAVLAPMLVLIGMLYATTPIAWAKAIGGASLFQFALCLGTVGSVALFLARLPLYRRGCFFTLGPRDLSGWHRKLYYAAYAMIIPSVCLLGLLLLSLK